MGVPGLWDILRPAGETRSLTHLAVVDGFEANRDGKRGYRVGIDASIWFYHATYGREGENPELRTLFFRCTRLMSAPFLPLFVFDGPKRPDVKRGKRISGKNHWMVQGMQEIINAFGFEWRMAPGEAEAELAYLNRIGVIDAVLSDDVDTFLFGAMVVVRNSSINLTGNRAHSLKNASGKDDGNHVAIYRSKDIANHPDIGLTQGGLILIGILRGGDYHPAGLTGCGGTIAHGLARCGFGDTLLTAAHTLPPEALPTFLSVWRVELREELRTNARGHVGRRHPALAKAIPDDFPDLVVLRSYTHPATSEHGRVRPTLAWDSEPDLGRIAGLCEMYFEWGIRAIIIKRFRTVLWPSAVLRILRRAALVADARGAGAPPSTPQKRADAPPVSVGTPSKMIARHFSSMQLNSPVGRAAGSDGEDADGEEPLVVRIHSSRTHASTDGILEYRLEVAPAQLVRLCEAGVKGLRTALPPELSDDDDDEDDEDGDGPKRKTKAKKPPPDPQSHLRIWLPASMVRMVEPELVDEFEGIQQMRAAKKAGKESASKAAGASGSRAKAKKAENAASTVAEEDSDSVLPVPRKKPTKAWADSEPASELPVPKKKPAASRARKKTVTHASDSDSAPPRVTKKPMAAQATKKTVSKPKASSSAAAEPERDNGAKGSTDRRNTVNEFFMASKSGVRQPKAKTQSITAPVTALSDDSPPSSSLPSGRQRVPYVELSDSSDGEPSRNVKTMRPPIVSSSRTSWNSGSTVRSSILSALDSSQAMWAPKVSPPKPSFVPRPFPIPLEKHHVGSDVDDPFECPAQSYQSPAHRTRPRSPASSESDSALAPLQKSPRKSPKHSSPRSNRTLPHSSHEARAPERAPSPSPLRARAPSTMRPLPSSPKRKPRADTSVINISSDSDSLPATKLAPLLRARTKPSAKPHGALKPTSKSNEPAMSTSFPSDQATKKAVPRSRSLRNDPEDIIDLT